MAAIGIPIPAPNAAPWFDVSLRVDHRRLRAQVDYRRPDDTFPHEVLVDLQSRILLASAIWWGNGDSNGSFWIPAFKPDSALDPDVATPPLAVLVAAAGIAAARLILTDVAPDLTASEDYQVGRGYGDVEPVVEIQTRVTWARLTVSRGLPEPVSPWDVPVVVDFLQRRRFGASWPPPGWPEL